MDGRTDGRTDKGSYRVACPQLKTNVVRVKTNKVEKSDADISSFVAPRVAQIPLKFNENKELAEGRIRKQRQEGKHASSVNEHLFFQ